MVSGKKAVKVEEMVAAVVVMSASTLRKLIVFISTPHTTQVRGIGNTIMTMLILVITGATVSGSQ